MSPKILVLSALCAVLMNIPQSTFALEGYQGCFKDQLVRALPLNRGRVDNRKECISNCRRAKLPYAGIQFGGECWCGYTFNKYGKSQACTMKCPHDTGCGGWWANSVYRVYGVSVKYHNPKGYQGCFNDQLFRALNIWGGYVYNIAECIYNCRVKGQSYAGLQYGHECRCGSAYNRYGKSDKCNMPCKLGGTCGGFWANSVYKVSASAISNKHDHHHDHDHDHDHHHHHHHHDHDDDDDDDDDDDE